MARAIVLSVFVLLAAAAAVHARPQRRMLATAPLAQDLQALAKARNATMPMKPAAKTQAVPKTSPKPKATVASPKPSMPKASPKPAATPSPAGAKIRDTMGTGSNGTSLSRARDTSAGGVGGLDVGFGTSGARVRETNSEGTGGLDLGGTGGSGLARTQPPKTSPKPTAAKASPKPIAVKASPKPAAATVKPSPKPSPKPSAVAGARVRDTNAEEAGNLNLGGTGGQTAGR